MNKPNQIPNKKTLFIRQKNNPNILKKKSINNFSIEKDSIFLLQELINTPQVQTEVSYLTSATTTFSITIPTSNCPLLFEKLLKKNIRHLMKIQSCNISENRIGTFIYKIKDIIEQNINDDEFGIQKLCKAIGLSRSQLHNKIKAETGLSTSIYVRSIRLKKARRLLEQTELNISEVAYAVGFKDPSYFSRLFTEKFKVSPSSYKKPK